MTAPSGTGADHDCGDAGECPIHDALTPPVAATVAVVLRRDQWELLRSVLWGAGMAYQAVDGGVTDGVLRMGDLPPDFRDLMRAVAAARSTDGP